jgi:Fe-S cluster biosynthesis and repair protein YggX
MYDGLVSRDEERQEFDRLRGEAELNVYEGWSDDEWADWCDRPELTIRLVNYKWIIYRVLTGESIQALQQRILSRDQARYFREIREGTFAL